MDTIPYDSMTQWLNDLITV